MLHSAEIGKFGCVHNRKVGVLDMGAHVAVHYQLSNQTAVPKTLLSLQFFARLWSDTMTTVSPISKPLAHPSL
jgi:hypothetical protein